MLATPRDVIEFSFDGKRRDVSIVSGEKHAKFFSKPWTGASNQRERGWYYAYFGGHPINAFCAVAFDHRQSRLFNELRFPPSSAALFGEGPADIKFKDGLHIEEKTELGKRTLSWTGDAPHWRVKIELENRDGKASFDYQFERLHPNVSPYKCVFQSYNQTLAHWWIAPMKGRFTFDATGDLKAMGLSGLEEYMGKELLSPFAYTEEVHLGLPLVAGGWTWNILACRKSGSPTSAPEKFLGFFSFFVSPKKGESTPINFQFYVVDYATGQFDVFGEATYRVEWEGGLPILHAKSDDERVSLDIRPAKIPIHRAIQGKKLSHFFSADIDYAAYPTIGTVTIDGVTYDAQGTSEITGNRFAYWL